MQKPFVTTYAQTVLINSFIQNKTSSKKFFPSDVERTVAKTETLPIGQLKPLYSGDPYEGN